MRVDVKKFLFLGIKSLKQKFFEEAQNLGIIHFINEANTRAPVPEEVHKFQQAIKVLRGQPSVDQEESTDYSQSRAIVEKILHFGSTLHKNEEELRVLKLEISRMEPLGNFSLEDLEFIQREGKRVIQFYYSEEGAIDQTKLPEDVEYLGNAHHLDYFVGIRKEAAQYPKMVEIKVDRTLDQLYAREAEIRRQNSHAHQELKTLAKYNEYLHYALIDLLNEAQLTDVQSYVRYSLDDSLFAVEGWVPVDKEDALKQLIEANDVYCEEIAIEDRDIIPTYLENEGIHRVGEDLTHIYDVPSHTDKDPSMWVLVFFALFFAMIIGDGGYGLVFLLISLYVRYKVKPEKKLGKRMLTLMTILCFSCIAWGVLTTSFFGIPVGFDNPLRKFSLIQWLAEKKAAFHMEHKDAVWKEWVEQIPALKGVTTPKEFVEQGILYLREGEPVNAVLNKFTDNILMELALMIGCIHIILSLGRYLFRNWPALGWILFIIGAYLAIPQFLQATSMIHFVFGVNPETGPIAGKYLMYIGMTLAVFFSFLKNKIWGILEPTNVIQIFGDILSYLRIYALGLSGSLLTATINEMAGSLNIVFGTLVIILGHSINMLLGVMGGVIHGLRLNFLEWYHYSFEGGGKLFSPLMKKKIE